MTQMSYRPYKFSLQKTWGKSGLREVKCHLLKTLQPVCRKVKKQRSTDLIDAPPRQRNEFSKENSGGLQDKYALSRLAYAVRDGTGLFGPKTTRFGILTFRRMSTAVNAKPARFRSREKDGMSATA